MIARPEVVKDSLIKRVLKEETAALRAEVKELRQALAGLLGLVRDTIATADDLHEVHAADAALTRARGKRKIA